MPSCRHQRLRRQASSLPCLRGLPHQVCLVALDPLAPSLIVVELASAVEPLQVLAVEESGVCAEVRRPLLHHLRIHTALLQRNAHVRGDTARNLVVDVDPMEELLDWHLAYADHERVPRALIDPKVAARVLPKTLHKVPSLGLRVKDVCTGNIPLVLLLALLHRLLHELENGLRLHAGQGLDPIDSILQLPPSNEPGVIEHPFQAQAQLLLAEGELSAILLDPEDGCLLGIFASGPDVPLLPQGCLALVHETNSPGEPVLPREVETAYPTEADA
mmetsp:Transcript_129550/g.276293  ORF Transcript_129550/g.276293 Transcript_129550/m.276293 type:complete len:274 (-) Transcript_129550:123-944(-)